jgi:hypothetical protein
MHLDETISGLQNSRAKVREKIEKLEGHKKSLFAPPHRDQERKKQLMVFKSYNPHVDDDYDDVVLR